MQSRTQLETASLGNPIGYYRSSDRVFYFVITFFMLCAVFFGWMGLTTPIDILILLIALGAFGCGVIVIGMLWQTPKLLRLFEQGIFVECRASCITIPWETLQQIMITTDISYGEPHVNVTLYIRGGKKLLIREKLGKIPKQTKRESHTQPMSIEEVVGFIVERSHPYRFQALLASYKAGEQVDFKYFRVSAEGIHVKKETLPWQQVAELRIDDNADWLAIIKSGQERPWNIVRIGDIPNRDILPALISAHHPQLVGEVTG